MVATSRLDRWLAPRLAVRAGNTRREIAADPTPITVRRKGRTTDLALTVRIVAGGTLAGRSRTETSAETRARVGILAEAGSDLRTGDRAHDAAGNVYLLTYVAPGQEFRVEADATVEQ